MRVILASSSKQRRELFDMIGLEYEVITSDVDEISSKKIPSKYVEELSLGKALSVKEKVEGNAIIISADTIIYYNGKKYEKPKSLEEAYSNLEELSGKKHTCYTGVTIIDLYKNKTITFHSKVDIYFRDIDKDEIKWYVENEKKIFKCCGYAPQGKASLFMDRVVGDYNVLFGISPKIIFDKLKELGYTVKDFTWKKDME